LASHIAVSSAECQDTCPCRKIDARGPPNARLADQGALNEVFLVSFSAAINSTTKSLPRRRRGCNRPATPPLCSHRPYATPSQFFNLRILLHSRSRVFSAISFDIVMLARGFGAFVSQCLVFFSSIENGTQTLERCRCFCVNLLYLWLSLFHLDHELQGKIMTTNSSRYNLGRRQDV